MNLLVLGYNARGLAEQALMAGHNVVGVDYFGDQDWELLNEDFFRLDFSTDKKCRIRGYGLKKNNVDYDSEQLIDFVNKEEFEFDKICYTSDLDNHPQLVAEIESNNSGKLIGNDSSTLSKLSTLRKNKKNNLFTYLTEQGINVPQVFFAEEELLTAEESITDAPLLKKPIASGGGIGIIKFEDSKEALNEMRARDWKDYYLQQYIPGISSSAVFIADGKEAEIFGVTKQLIGVEELGGDGFKYCGNVTMKFGNEVSKSIFRQLQKIVNILTERFNLVGLNGIDFIIKDNKVFFLELNPRYTGSMELFSIADSLNLFQWHQAGCEGRLPRFDYFQQSAEIESKGYTKGIIYSQEDIRIQPNFLQRFMERIEDNNDQLINDVLMRDIPQSNEVILAGSPLCTLIIKGSSKEAWDRLMLLQDFIYNNLVTLL